MFDRTRNRSSGILLEVTKWIDRRIRNSNRIILRGGRMSLMSKENKSTNRDINAYTTLIKHRERDKERDNKREREKKNHITKGKS